MTKNMFEILLSECKIAEGIQAFYPENEKYAYIVLVTDRLPDDKRLISKVVDIDGKQGIVLQRLRYHGRNEMIRVVDAKSKYDRWFYEWKNCPWA